MTETFSNDRWNAFESSGRVSDYLFYKGIGTKNISSLKGESVNAHDNGGNGNLAPGTGG